MAQLKATDNYIWSLADVLGQGATGAVYMARHKVKDANLSKLSAVIITNLLKLKVAYQKQFDLCWWKEKV